MERMVAYAAKFHSVPNVKDEKDPKAYFAIAVAFLKFRHESGPLKRSKGNSISLTPAKKRGSPGFAPVGKGVLEKDYKAILKYGKAMLDTNAFIGSREDHATAEALFRATALDVITRAGQEKHAHIMNVS